MNGAWSVRITGEGKIAFALIEQGIVQSEAHLPPKEAIAAASALARASQFVLKVQEEQRLNQEAAELAKKEEAARQQADVVTDLDGHPVAEPKRKKGKK